MAIPGDPQGAVLLSLLLQDSIQQVSLERDKYLTPAPNLRGIRVSHESQYTRYLNFFPRIIPMLNSLPSLVFSSKTIEEFKSRLLVQWYVI